MDDRTEGFLRPEAVILGEDALIPDRNLIVPPPNQFTHEVTRATPYFYDREQPDVPPVGQFAEGTLVVLLVFNGGSHCRVADRHGLYVETEYDSLKRL